MGERRHLYSYRGPVTAFGKIVTNNWYATTYAVSKGQAKTNLMYRFKTEHGRTPNSKIELPGKIILIS